MQGLKLDLPSLSLPGVLHSPKDCRRNPWPKALGGPVGLAGLDLTVRHRLPLKVGHFLWGRAKASTALSCGHLFFRDRVTSIGRDTQIGAIFACLRPGQNRFDVMGLSGADGACDGAAFAQQFNV